MGTTKWANRPSTTSSAEHNGVDLPVWLLNCKNMQMYMGGDQKK